MKYLDDASRYVYIIDDNAHTSVGNTIKFNHFSHTNYCFCFATHQLQIEASGVFTIIREIPHCVSE